MFYNVFFYFQLVIFFLFLTLQYIKGFFYMVEQTFLKYCMNMKIQESWFEKKKITFHFGICNGWTKDTWTN